MKKVLKKQGIKSKLVVSHLDEWGGSHVYLIVGDYLVDITATQFCVRTHVVIKPLKKVKEHFWKKPKMVKNPREYFWEWGTQNPFIYKIVEKNHLTKLLR